MAPETTGRRTFLLPALIIGPGDVSRAERELRAVETYLEQQRLRTPGRPMAAAPKMSRILESFVTENKLSLLQPRDRQDLVAYLQQLQAHAPVVHLSFATEPSFPAVQKLTMWLRQTTHTDVLVRVGVQPALVAGCVMRTANRYFDFSLRKYLDQQRGYLLQALDVSAAAPPASQEASA